MVIIKYRLIFKKILESNQEWDIFNFIKFWEKYQLTESLILDVTNNLGTHLLFSIFTKFFLIQNYIFFN